MTAAAVEGGLAAGAYKEAIVELLKGNYSRALGLFGEGTLRLLGASVNFTRGLKQTCFVAGTPLRTADGSKPIEEFKSYEEHGDDCDLILTQSEFDPQGPLELKRVLRKFIRVSPILNLHVGGKIIGTTAEHPFYVLDKGWITAAELKIGDLLQMHDGNYIPVEGIADSGRVETVYNLEVEDYHTYFVGELAWGWSVWAHNATYHLNSNGATSRFGIYEIYVNGILHKVGKADLKRITKSSGLPTRLHQQIRKLEQQFGKGTITHSLTEAGTTTTRWAKAAENAILRDIFEKLRFVPLGNKKSFIP